MEERIYRRCVGGLVHGDPRGLFAVDAVAAGAAHQPGKVRGVRQPGRPAADARRSSVLDWPYVEGLRIDEAMHPLTLMVRAVRRGVAAAERLLRLVAEAWLQERQVDRGDPFDRKAQPELDAGQPA